ncbi:MAG: GldG family protein, partial [Lachnospiraceae bacterium]|nr:GldG family protein [Lachnospiraceae bacterium]
SVILILACNLLGDLFDSIPVAWLSDLLGATINFSGRLMTIYLGSFDLTSIVYFISVTALFLFLTTQVIQKRRFTVSRANLSVTAYSTAMIAVCIAVVVVLNLVVLQIPDEFREVDLTENRIYTIGDESKRIASEITDDITLYFMAQESDDAMQTKDTTVEKILKSYVNAGSHLKLTYIDPIVNAKFYQRYTDTDPGYSGVIVVDETNGRSKAVAYQDMYESEIDYQTYQEKTTGYDMEGQITSALQYVTLSEDALVQAYVTSGHGELPISSAYAKILENDNIHTEDLELLTAEKVPDDAELLIIQSPSSDFTPSEADLVIDYLNKGGNLLVCATTEVEAGTELTNFKKILDWYGISLMDGMVLDYTPGNYYATFQTPSYLLPNLSSDDPVTSSLRSVGLQTVFLPEALAIDTKVTDGITVTPLLTTSEDSYLTSDPDQKNAQSFTVGVKAERSLDSGMSTMILYSCGYLFTDEVDNLIAGMNSRLFDNSIDALVELSTDFVTIPTKPMDTFLTIPMTVGNFITVIGFIFIVALVVIIAGIAVWAVRRKK